MSSTHAQLLVMSNSTRLVHNIIITALRLQRRQPPRQSQQKNASKNILYITHSKASKHSRALQVCKAMEVENYVCDGGLIKTSEKFLGGAESLWGDSFTLKGDAKLSDRI